MLCLICLKSIFVSISRKNLQNPPKMTRFTPHHPTIFSEKVEQINIHFITFKDTYLKKALLILILKVSLILFLASIKAKDMEQTILGRQI